jgi:hypothetical protein
VRQDEPKPKQTQSTTHTLRDSRRRPEEVSRARESRALGPDADLEEADRGRPDPPRRRPRGGQLCFGEGSAANQAQGRKLMAGSAWLTVQPEKARPEARPKRRGQYNRARQATPPQNSKSSVVRGMSDARCRPRRGPQSGTRRRTRGAQTRARTQHTQTDAPDADLKRSVVQGVKRGRPRRRPRRGWPRATRQNKTAGATPPSRREGSRAARQVRAQPSRRSAARSKSTKQTVGATQPSRREGSRAARQVRAQPSRRSAARSKSTKQTVGATQPSRRGQSCGQTSPRAALEEVSRAEQVAFEARPQRRGQEGAAERRKARPMARRSRSGQKRHACAAKTNRAHRRPRRRT